METRFGGSGTYLNCIKKAFSVSDGCFSFWFCVPIHSTYDPNKSNESVLSVEMQKVFFFFAKLSIQSNIKAQFQ